MDISLKLRWSAELDVITYTDASLGTASRGRSVVAQLHKMNELAGAVNAPTKAADVVFMSSFEAELDGVAKGLRGLFVVKE